MQNVLRTSSRTPHNTLIPHPLTLLLYRALPCQLRPRPYTLLHAKAHIVARLKLKSINSINQKGYNLMPDLAKALGTGYSGVLGGTRYSAGGYSVFSFHTIPETCRREFLIFEICHLKAKMQISLAANLNARATSPTTPLCYLLLALCVCARVEVGNSLCRCSAGQERM